MDPTIRDQSTQSAHDDFYASLPAHNVAPLWTVLSRLVPPTPEPSALPTHWPYAPIRPLLLRSGTLLTAAEAERRVLMLVNPALQAPYTTDTIYAGLQLILPGETAPAHRHTAFALRFIVEGSRGFTAVEGKKVMMERGDVILTPGWSWHDHGSEGTGPMVWLDGLDLPVFQFLKVNFAENYEEERYPSELAEGEDASGLKFPWANVASALNKTIATETHAKHEYTFRDGRFLSKTIGAQAERVAAGSTTVRSRETCSFVYHVFEGKGWTEIGTREGEVKSVEWKSRDTFCVPAWCSVRHCCTMEEGNAYLFAINDRPMVRALGLERREVLEE